MTYSKVNGVVLLGTVLAVAITSCGRNTQAPLTPTTPQSKIVAVFGDSPAALAVRIKQAQHAGLTPRFITIRVGHTPYQFPVYARIARAANSLVALGYRTIYVFRASETVVEYSGESKAINLTTLPTISANISRIEGRPDLCLDCIGVATSRAQVRPIAVALSGISDPWQITPDYRPWAAIPGRQIFQPANLPTITHITVTSGGGSITSSSGGGGGGGGGGGCAEVKPSFGSQPFIRKAGGGGGGCRGNGTPTPSGTNAHKIYNQALYWLKSWASSKKGPDGGRLACAWMVSQILKDAIGQWFNGGNENTYNGIPDNVSDVEDGLKAAEGSGLVTAVSQGQAVQGDIAVEGSDQHIGICESTSGCTTVMSNGNHDPNGNFDPCFCYQDGPNFPESYPNETVPPRFYHINN